MKVVSRLLFLCLVVSASATAEDPANVFRGEPAVTKAGRFDTNAYGTTAVGMYTINGLQFVPALSTSEFSVDGPTLTRTYVGAGSAIFYAAVTLPTGTKVVALEAEGCDNHASLRLQVGLLECDLNDCTPIVWMETGSAETPGCSFFSTPISPALTLDQFYKSYILHARFHGVAELRLRAVRLYYQRQVSPAPAVASFTDVPTTHPFFRFIEALKRAGITGGCSATAFCPDAPLTRGQMAVFLATALGLHFPN